MIGPAGVQARTKRIDGKPRNLFVFTMPLPLGGGAKAVLHACQVGSSAPIGDLKASVRAALGRGPTDDSATSAEWIFTERNGRRTFLPDGSAAAMSAALKTGPVEIVHVPADGLFVMYNEVVRAP
jgi:hypothetical protein